MTPLARAATLALGFAVGAAAPAAAWTQPEGQGLFIGTLTLKDLSQTHTGSGRRASGFSNTILEFSPYVAYGVTPWPTGIVQSRVHLGWGDQATQGGLDSTDLGARAPLWSDDRAALSVYGLLRWPAPQSRFGGTGLGGDWGGSYGSNVSFGATPGLFVTETGYRHYTDRPNGWRGDLAVGVLPADRWLLLGQSFTLVQHAASGRQSTLHLSEVRELMPRVSLQIGTYTTVAGRNYDAENGGLVALWYRF
jgi:hypothetical protein